MKSQAIRLVWLGALLALSGCATFTEQFSGVEHKMIQGHPDQALSMLEKDPGPERDRVLYLLNRAMLQRMNGKLEDSNASLEQAKTIIKQLYATSVTETAGSLTVNDATRSYTGAPYEQVMVHLIEALNYLQLGKLDDARVEVLQMDVRLRELHQEKRSAYMEDAFGRYLAGMIYEDLGEYSDAMISYRKAFQAYERQQKDFHVPVPHGLQLALLRLSKRMGLDNEEKNYASRFNIHEFETVTQRRDQGRLVLILGNGLAPRIHEKSITIRDHIHGQVHRIALPYYSNRDNRPLLGGMSIKADGHEQQASLVDNIDAVAKKSLEEEMPTIRARALARAVAKANMVNATKRKNDQNHPMLGLLANVFTVATERADTRSWVTLPSDFYLASMSLPPGHYDVQMQFLDKGGRVIGNKDFKDVEVKAGASNYQFYQWISPAYSSGR